MTGRRRHAGERGTGLLEVVVTVSLFLLLLGALLETHTSFLFASRRQDQAIEARSIERLAGAELTTVLRSAEVLWPPSGATAARDEITATVPIRAGGGSETVRLRRDLAGGQIVREVLTAPGGSVVTTRVVASGVVDVGTPFVRYFAADGSELDPGVVVPATLVACSMRLALDLAVVPAPGRSPVRTTVEVTPRDRRAEEASC